MQIGEKFNSWMLHVGLGRANITPPVGIRMWGYTAQECLSDSIERELLATAIVLAAAQTKVALIACDLLMIQQPQADCIRRLIGDRLEISPDHVLINTSHTHLGPMLPGWQVDTPQQQELQERYFSVLVDALVGVAAMADSRLQPARLGMGKGNVALGINRRERLPGGHIIIGNNPEGPVDRDVDVIRIDNLKGVPIATIFSSAVHPIVLGFNTSQLSPDFVGPARDLVESTTGAPALFLQGAAGNVSPICGVGAGGRDQYENLARMGALLGSEAVKTWAQIRTHNRLGTRHVVQSVAPVSSWQYEEMPEECIRDFRVAVRRVELAMGLLPDRAAAQEAVRESRARLAEARLRGVLAELHVANRLAQHADLVLRAIDGPEPLTRELQVWALRINDLGIVAVNGEPFAELAMEVKRRSSLSQTMFLGYSNGCLGYFPTREAFDEGGMEVCESVKNYLLPAPFTREWGPTIVRTSLQLLHSLQLQDVDDRQFARTAWANGSNDDRGDTEVEGVVPLGLPSNRPDRNDRCNVFEN